MKFKPGDIVINGDQDKYYPVLVIDSIKGYILKKNGEYSYVLIKESATLLTSIFREESHEVA